jgi:hypothetical protein
MSQETSMQITPTWEFVADTVMGGVSTGRVSQGVRQGREASRLTGTVSLDNNGGFVQMAFDLAPDGSAVDASDFTGVELQVFGNAERYDLRLRTDALTRPWQSFKAELIAPATWTTLRIPFSDFNAHRTSARFDPAQLRRIGVLAIGRVFEADIAVATLQFYR